MDAITHEAVMSPAGLTVPGDAPFAPPAAAFGIRFASTPIPLLDRSALAAVRLLFDRGWYLLRHPDVAASGIDPFDHFLTSGLAEGRSPCLLFDPAFYLSQPGAPDTVDFLFLHYLTIGVRLELDPHPLVDAGYYAAQHPPLKPGTNPLTHLLGPGRRENRRPNPLFDAAYYRRQNRTLDRLVHPLMHYAAEGWKDRLQPHPLFDPATYAEERPDVAAVGLDPLAHYLHSGRLEGARPNWLFDPAHYLAGCADPVAPADALLHFARFGCGPGRSPNALFDAAHYMREHPDVARSGMDPFLHFLEFGLPENRDPHPLFDSWFYRSQNADVAESGIPPFLHYLRYGAREGRDPNPFFPAAAYLDRHPDARADPAGPLAHFLATPETHLERLCDAFDPAYYRCCYPACTEAVARGVPPLSHYLSTGRNRDVSPLPMPLDWHPWSLPVASAGRDDAVSLLMIVQDASHGEAGLCALRALEQMAIDPSLACHVVISHDGPLASAFASLAPTLALASDRWSDGPARRDQMADILHSFRDHDPRGVVLVNSTAACGAAVLAGRLGLRVLAWLHEMPVTIDSLHGGDETMQALARVAFRIVAQSEPAREALLRHYRLPPAQVASVADGVALAPVNVDARLASLELREALELPPDALLVLGRGGIEFRSGTDLFIRVASQVVARAAREAAPDNALRQAFFLWLGETCDPLFAALCRHDVDRLGLSDRVRLIDPQRAPARMLPGADLFLLTARDGASGAAILEARGNGLPVIGFDGCGQSIGPGSRDDLIEVGYLDLDAMADAIMIRGNRPARRTRTGPETRQPGPSWADWHAGLRLMLAQDAAMPAGLC